MKLEQIHIDIVRNATDDFNPFHDPHRWQNIQGNPFGGLIALGFQLAALALDRVSNFRKANNEASLPLDRGLHFSNYQFTFASAVTAGAELAVQVRKTANNIDSKGELSNRVSVKQDGKLALIGTRRDTFKPLAQAGDVPSFPAKLSEQPDRAFLGDSGFFLKRKYLMTSNGKNFCAGCFIPQHHYFDELAERVFFPPSFILSLVSCALLERAHKEGHDFESSLYVYTSHHFSFDKRVQRELKSNDRLHLLVGSPSETGGGEGRGHTTVQHACYGIVDDDRLLFSGSVGLAGLRDILVARSSSA